jgi:tetratricopeptide (TPR) repeat protein
MLTGTNPPYHGVHDNPEYGFGNDEMTLARILKGRGFYTGGIVSSFVLNNRYGLGQGFDVYMDDVPPAPIGQISGERKGGDTTRIALDFLQRNRNKPFFLFLHYFDPHVPYAPPEPFASRFRDSRYEGEIAFVDSCIGQVIDRLKGQGLYDSTLLVITGDHGEMLGEHGEKCHAFFIYQGAVKVPLIVKLPGQKGGRVVEQPVGLIDIVPTICGLLEIKPPSQVQGLDLAACVKGQEAAPPGRYYYCESLTATKLGGNSLLGIVRDNWKYIQTTRPELYDLEKDPGEKNNLVSSQPELASGLRDCLKSLLEKEVRVRHGGATAEWDPKAIANLEALGYVRGSVSKDLSFSQDKTDPKDLIGFHEGCSEVRRLAGLKRLAEAGSLCKELLSRNSRYPDLHFLLAGINYSQGDYAGAVESLTKAIEMNPKEYLYHKNLALSLEKLNRMDDAFAHFQEAEKLEPRSAEVLMEYALALKRMNRLDEAVKKLRKALQLTEEAKDTAMAAKIRNLLESCERG